LKHSFEFSPENQQEFQDILKRYPIKRAAFLPTLHLAQEQNGYISEAVEKYVSEILEVPLIDVREVLTFYSLFHRRAPGRHHIRVCMSLSCWLRGSEQIKKHLEQTLEASSGEVARNGAYSWEAVPDCMGACEIAPMIQLDKDYYGDLTPERIEAILRMGKS
jgi:NADH-quinone oxidoreductase E subunit